MGQQASSMKKKQFTQQDLLRKGFKWDGNKDEEKYLVYKASGCSKFLVTNDYSEPSQDSWFVDYGLHNPIANLDETLVDDFIKTMNDSFDIESWFEKVISR